jgi:hypothetical protein
MVASISALGRTSEEAGSVKKIKAVAALSLGACLALTAGGCSQASDTRSDKPGVVRLDAPAGKCWSGAFGSSTKDGCGSKEFRIEGEEIIFANAQKQDPGTWKLTLVLRVGGEEKDRKSTTAESGVVQISE